MAENTLGLLILGGRPADLNRERIRKGMYILVFDIRRNRFIGNDLNLLIEGLESVKN